MSEVNIDIRPTDKIIILSGKRSCGKSQSIRPLYPSHLFGEDLGKEMGFNVSRQKIKLKVGNKEYQPKDFMSTQKKWAFAIKQGKAKAEMEELWENSTTVSLTYLEKNDQGQVFQYSV